MNGADVRTPARCVGCGHKWKPRPLNVYKGSGCPNCAQYGFNGGKPAFVYLMKKPHRDMIRCGREVRSDGHAGLFVAEGPDHIHPRQQGSAHLALLLSG